MALRPEVVDFIGPHLLDDPDEVGAVGEVSVVEKEAHPLLVRVDIEVVDPVGVKEARPPFYPVHLIALLEQEFGEVGPVLSGNAGDKCFFHAISSVSLFGRAPGPPRGGPGSRSARVPSGALTPDRLRRRSDRSRVHVDKISSYKAIYFSATTALSNSRTTFFLAFLQSLS